MNKVGKIAYFIIGLTFFCMFDLYFSEYIINSRFLLRDNPIIDFIYAQNTGAAFSIFENSQSFLIITAVTAIFLISVYLVKNIEKFSTFAVFWCAMLTSGIGCNLYERLCYGYVRDFFKLNFVGFPIFNISDIFISVGVFALVILIIKNKYLKNENSNR